MIIPHIEDDFLTSIIAGEFHVSDIQDQQQRSQSHVGKHRQISKQQASSMHPSG